MCDFLHGKSHAVRWFQLLKREFCSPQAGPSRGAGMRTGVIRHFDVTLLFATPWSSRLQAVMSLGGGGRCTGRAPMLSQAGLPW
jgi:hypothetical protein